MLVRQVQERQNHSSTFWTIFFGIPVLMMDIKGDFSGIAKEGEEKAFITESATK
jgi:hypothetical protein